MLFKYSLGFIGAGLFLAYAVVVVKQGLDTFLDKVERESWVHAVMKERRTTNGVKEVVLESFGAACVIQDDGLYANFWEGRKWPMYLGVCRGGGRRLSATSFLNNSL